MPLLLKEEQRQLKQPSVGRKAALQSGVVLEAWENTWNVLLLLWFQPRFKCPERIWKVAKTTAFLKTAMFRFGWGRGTCPSHSAVSGATRQQESTRGRQCPAGTGTAGTKFYYSFDSAQTTWFSLGPNCKRKYIHIKPNSRVV